MTQSDMDYLLKRFGQAFLAAGNSLIGSGTSSSSGNSNSGTGNTGTGNTGTTPPVTGTESTDPAFDNNGQVAIGEVAVIASRAPLRSQPTKDINVDLGRMLEGERAPLDAMSDDKKWYRLDVRNFAGLHTIPDDTTYAWGEASNFEIIKLR